MSEGKNYNKLSPQSGKELADEFFKSLPELEGVETKIASLLQELYNAGRLTKENIMEGLEKLRKEKNEGD
ncbi:unnamed protein product [marine sediment metagenome]|uniref:Uncharacterized protein n=1 Tax=marine sediment metagenome TaxID=412755 RepID=X1HF14_9ZZZZ